MKATAYPAVALAGLAGLLILPALFSPAGRAPAPPPAPRPPVQAVVNVRPPQGKSLAERLRFYLDRHAEGRFVARDGRGVEGAPSEAWLELSSVAIEAACDHLLDAPVFVEPGSGKPQPRPTLLEFEPGRAQPTSRHRVIQLASQFAGEQSKRVSRWLTRWVRGADPEAAAPDGVERVVERAAEVSSARAVEALASRLFAEGDRPRPGGR